MLVPEEENGQYIHHSRITSKLNPHHRPWSPKLGSKRVKHDAISLRGSDTTTEWGKNKAVPWWYKWAGGGVTAYTGLHRSKALFKRKDFVDKSREPEKSHGWEEVDG